MKLNEAKAASIFATGARRACEGSIVLITPIRTADGTSRKLLDIGKLRGLGGRQGAACERKPTGKDRAASDD